MTPGIHTEQAFEAELEAHLLAHGYESASSSDYDRAAALFPRLVVDFVRTTQPKAWDKLETILEDKLAALFLEEVRQVMDYGFTFYGCQRCRAYPQPGLRATPELDSVERSP